MGFRNTGSLKILIFIIVKNTNYKFTEMHVFADSSNEVYAVACVECFVSENSMFRLFTCTVNALNAWFVPLVVR